MCLFLSVFHFFCSEGIRRIDLRFLANTKMLFPIRRIFILGFSLVYICLVGQYGWALTSATSQYRFMLATHYNMLWIKLLKHFFLFSLQCKFVGQCGWSRTTIRTMELEPETASKTNENTSCQKPLWIASLPVGSFAGSWAYPLTALEVRNVRHYFWEGAIIIQPSKERYSLFLGISYRHNT